MRKRRFQIALVMFNLLSLNAYALVATGMDDHRAAMTNHIHHQSKDGTRFVTTHVDHGMHDCDMPCCDSDSNHKDNARHVSHCLCNAGMCGTVQIQIIASYVHRFTFRADDEVDAMSTTIPIQHPSQRLLKPPIR